MARTLRSAGHTYNPVKASRHQERNLRNMLREARSMSIDDILEDDRFDTIETEEAITYTSQTPAYDD